MPRELKGTADGRRGRLGDHGAAGEQWLTSAKPFVDNYERIEA